MTSRLVVTQEPAVHALVTRALPDDLLVVGTRGEGRLAGLIAGSVCRGVLDAMPCDVMVVPPAMVPAGPERADRRRRHRRGVSAVPGERVVRRCGPLSRRRAARGP